MSWIDLAQVTDRWRAVVNVDKYLGYIKCRKVCDQLKNCQLIKDSALWTWLFCYLISFYIFVVDGVLTDCFHLTQSLIKIQHSKKKRKKKNVAAAVVFCFLG